MNEFNPARYIDKDPPLQANEQDLLNYLAYLKEQINFLFRNWSRQFSSEGGQITDLENEVSSIASNGLPMLDVSSGVHDEALTGRVINMGLISASSMGISGSADAATIVGAWLRHVCSKYTHANVCIFEGIVLANSYRMMRFYIYDTSILSNGIPQNASGQMQNYNGNVWFSGSNNYNIFADLLQV